MALIFYAFSVMFLELSLFIIIIHSFIQKWFKNMYSSSKCCEELLQPLSHDSIVRVKVLCGVARL